MPEKRKKIGLFGGSFDPPHLGHLTLAQDAYEALSLDSVWFIPTYLSPYKSSFHLDPFQRTEMVQLMVENDDRFECSCIEVDSGARQYSVDTISKLKVLYPDTDFFWLIGTDQLNALHQWKDIKRLAKMAQLVVFKRPGYKMDLKTLKVDISIQQVEIHENLISSSEIRDRFLQKLPVYMFLHPSVDACIVKKQYYSE